jgi:hypothetical protein
VAASYREQVDLGECLLPFIPESFIFLLLSQNPKIKMNSTVIVPVVLYGCNAWFLPLKKECTLRVYENRVLREEVTGGCRRLRNEELHDLLFS